MDTEFPGVIFRPGTEKHQYSHLSPTFNYRLMKANVDALNLIQLGLTLSDPYGNLPDFGTPFSHIWEFNFSDFNLDSDYQNPESITLLKNQGIDFDRNRQEGIDSQVFASILVRAGLSFPIPNSPSLGSPSTVYFGGSVLDMKHVIKYCDGLYGGLERVAKALDVDRVAGKSHQAGSDSLLTMKTFLKLRDLYFNGDGDAELDQFDLVLHGLELELKKLAESIGLVWVRPVGIGCNALLLIGRSRCFLVKLAVMTLDNKAARNLSPLVVRLFAEVY
ncbi:polynucleotidyl transferase, ribonuclease H-like superfamily protein [Actinidia rufa]|uniref:poly(A)-specific ribonuclease n=1 Tax=Actinidia rufa TaxID=165716 RepID=A0A7J0EVY4_9ERIC|nr:polynucleotidyl transferase, ribonuclease H-like superfamily protein [Actinidia rufa]